MGRISVDHGVRIIPSEIQQSPQSNSNGLQQVAQTQNARAQSLQGLKAPKAISINDLTKAGGLREVSGYRPSLKSQVSHTISRAINFFRGQQATSGVAARDRRGNTTFQQLEQLADKVRSTATYKNEAPERVGEHRKNLEEFQSALQQYVDSKPGKLSQETEMLAGIKNAISALSYGTIIRKANPNSGQQVTGPDAHSHASTSSFSNEALHKAESALEKAGIKIPGMNPDQKIRLADLMADSPDRAKEVVARAHHDAKDLDVLLDIANDARFETRSLPDLIAGKRAQLTDAPELGGMGIDPTKLECKNRLGGGNFGDVHIFATAEDNSKPVQKLAGKTSKNSADTGELQREEAFLARLPDHPNLIKSYGIHTIEGKEVLLQEYVSGGSLSSTLATIDWDSLTDKHQLMVLKHVAAQIFTGLAELQKLGIAHEDLRADNLLFDKETLNIKLADFGMSANRGEEDIRQLFPIKWSSPEIFVMGRRTSIVGDSFSASRVLVGELINHTNLFNTDGRTGNLAQHSSDSIIAPALQGIAFPSELPAATKEALDALDNTGDLAKFFAAISHPDPTQRMRANEALKHPFLASPPPREELENIFNNKVEKRSTNLNVVASNNSPGSELVAPSGYYGET